MSDLKSRLVEAVQEVHAQHRTTPAEAQAFGGGFSLDDTANNPAPTGKKAAVLVACVPNPEPSVVLTVRAQGVPQHAGQVALPGGRHHPGEAFPNETALREAHEEVGLDPLEAEVLGVLLPVATLTGYAVTPVVAWVDRPVQLAPQEREVSQIFHWPLVDVLNPERYSTHRLSVPTPGRVMHYRIWRLQAGQWPIWGATAEILAQLAHRWRGRTSSSVAWR